MKDISGGGKDGAGGLSIVARLEETLRGLHCGEAVTELRSAMRRAPDATLAHAEFLDELLEPVVRRRERARMSRWRSQAGFPRIAELKDFEPHGLSADDWQTLHGLRGSGWFDRGGVLILHGPAGAGNTHIATGLGLEAIAHGYETSFVSGDRLIEIISDAIEEDEIQDGQICRKKVLGSFSRPRLLIIDGFEYDTVEAPIAEVLSSLVHARHGFNGLTIFTSRMNPEAWGPFFGPGSRTLELVRSDSIEIEVRE